MTFDPQVAEALAAAIDELPVEIKDILDKAKSGDMSEQDAMRNLMEAVAGDPKMAGAFQAIMMQRLAPLRDAPVPSEAFVPRGGQGMPRLNPLMEAALIERAQFDGDMPELRTGPMHPDETPAIPIKTTVRDPVGLGLMLKKAGEKRKAELENQAAERRRLVEERIAANPDTLALMNTAGLDLELAGSADTDLAGYRRGELPKPMSIARPSGATLAKMSDAERHEMAWRFLSTTQGRRSAIDIIRELVATFLGKHFTVVQRDFDPKAPRVQPLAYAEWKIALEGKGATQPAFSLVDVSSKVLGTRLLAGLDGNFPDKAVLEVESINAIADREVGWMARLLPTD